LITPEIQILLCCAKVETTENRRTQLLELIPQISDWEIVLELANHHGLIPLLFLHLKETVWEHLPKEARASLESRYRANAIHALSMTSELLRLMRLLQDHKIFALPYKGPALAEQLFGDVAMRQYGDIDVVVSVQQIHDVISLMAKNSWEKKYAISSSQEKIYIQNYKDYSLYSQPKNILFEMHWEFAAKAYSFPLEFAEVKPRCNELKLTGVPIPILSPEDLLLILSFHGAVHKWERLGWLTDIAQLLSIYPNLDWEWVWSKSKELRCERLLRFSLLLAHRLLNAPLPDHIFERLNNDKKAIDLARIIEANLINDPFGIPGAFEHPLFHVEMREHWEDKLRYIWHTIFRVSEEDWVSLPFALPPVLFFLYYPVRLARVFKRYVLRSSPSA
jgi:Uncharacterised nucleotidyltransferase